MATDPDLQSALADADPADHLPVLVVLKPVALPGGDADLVEQRAAAATAAHRTIVDAIGDAAAVSGQGAPQPTIFASLGTARLTAPAALISALADNPAVASISLDR